CYNHLNMYNSFFSFLSLPRPPRPTLFPYTTLFRSIGGLNTGVYMQEMIPLFKQGDIRETGLSTDMALVDGNLPINPETNKPGSLDRKSTRLNSSHVKISYAVFCLKKKKKNKKNKNK